MLGMYKYDCIGPFSAVGVVGICHMGREQENSVRRMS